jgi:uncharacterized protein
LILEIIFLISDRQEQAVTTSHVGETYHVVMIQPTTLCNLDCAYCYLPQRKKRREVTREICAAVAEDIRNQQAPWRVAVLWHGGEPTTISAQRFRDLLDPFESLRQDGGIHHVIQTNGTLVDDEWCRLLVEYDFRVGLSIDGPAWMNERRLNLAGQPTFDRAMAGYHALAAARLDIHVICVVTPDTIDHTDELLAFLDDHNFEAIAFNIEEREGVNTTRPLVTQEEARGFWRKVIRHARTTSGATPFRELGPVIGYLRGDTEFGQRDPTPTVAYNGDVTLLSPELAGITAPEHDDFVVGNVLQSSIRDMIRRGADYTRAFERGLDTCQRECSFWHVCYGGYASNRWAEHGRFDSSETAYCRNSRQAVVLAALDEAHPDHDAELIRKLIPLTGGNYVHP